MQVAEHKAALRAQALARRDALAPAERDRASRRIAERILAMAADFRPGPVSVFWPIRSEIDTRPLMLRLFELGFQLALPVVARPGLKFRAWQPGDNLRPTGFGLSEPLDSAPQVEPATMLVPLAAFDQACNRLGYGAGFYDHAIAELAERHPPFTIGLAFAVQQVASVPTEQHDKPLDAVVTEGGLFARGKGHV